MGRLKKIALAAAALLAALAASGALAAPTYVGDCGIWASKSHDYYSKNYSGSQSGFNAAKAYVGTNGIIQVLPGCEEEITVGSLPDSVVVIMSAGGRWGIRGGTLVAGRFGPRSTATAGGAVRIIDGESFAQTDVGVRAAVNEVIAAGGGLVFLPKGRYRFTDTVTLNNASGVTIEGVGDSTIAYLDHATGSDLFAVTGTSSLITFRNVKLDGDYQNNTAGRGIDVESATARDILVENVTVMRTNDAAIASQGARTIVRNCRIYEIGDASAGDRTGILLYGSAADSSRIENNDVTRCKDSALLIGSNNDYCTVTGNKLLQPPGYGNLYTVSMLPSGGKYLTFKDNLVDGCDSAVLAVFGADSTIISGNTFTNGRIYSGLYLLRGSGVIVSNNICSYNVHHGIFVGYDQGDCRGVLMEGNYCVNNLDGGIIVNPSTTRTFTDIVIQNNVCTNNGTYGVTVAAASFASTASVGPNVIENNGSGPLSLAVSNWTYNATRVHSLRVTADLSVGLETIPGYRTYATLGTPANGTITYCADCTAASPTAGGGTGNIVARENGVWNALRSGTGTGETNTASNVGTGEGTVFKQKTGVNLEFKTLKQGTNVTITNNASDITIAASGGASAPDSTTASNVGSGAGLLFKQETANNLEFKRIAAGSNISITNGASDVTAALANFVVLPDSMRVGRGATFQDSVFIRNRLAVEDSARFDLGFCSGGQKVNKILRGSATLNFDLTTVSFHDLTISLAGAAVGDEVALGVPNGSMADGVLFYAWVSATGTVKVRAMRTCDTEPDPASGTFKVTVFQ